MLNSNERTYKEIDLKRRCCGKIAVIVIVYLAWLGFLPSPSLVTDPA